ncbi:MAG: sigma-54-dependent Fis family transcriptional regulator [Rhodospirillales bacterium]|nr:sigma-54-dependent Fis family transcriptional regulator [Rhodospirillales bacterium]MCB9965182.1 sigma-54-dependent Fis family transcriptional regulator [Rhodospirillales bacterium]MCB9973201.1 sigma-54-dependent Fis family transcriptional regulator [Rhodospirillales bacterium]MCB9979539.1 sigma-54-dependent Fis family transcriptional regulator [Rhodospirillales bacterium]
MRLMIIGHLEGYISAAGKIALQKGAKVIHCEDTEEALAALRNGRSADLAMVDIKQNIGKFIKDLNAERIHIEVVACGVGSEDSRAAVKAIEDGAKEYIPLPPDAELIAAVLTAASEEQSDMIANDAAMKRVLMLADKIAPSEATVLITGESGTGKEVMSRYIHNKSKRKDGAFIALNCAAIPENLLESELFGHEKGAFTGATARRIGKFEEANNGTLLLDEISEMHPALQAKLLRAIQERVITRVGSNADVKVNVRILATSNRNLEKSVEKGEFREDLYFRLNVMNIKLPALRERPGDVLPLAQFFADKYAEANGVDKKRLSAAASEKLQRYPWRGNIRELENTMHRAIIIALEDEIEADAIMLEETEFTGASIPSAAPAPVAKQASPEVGGVGTVQNPGAVEAFIGRPLADVERDLILDTLEHTFGNRTHAANILGISIRTLRNKLNQYKDEGIDVPKASEG